MGKGHSGFSVNVQRAAVSLTCTHVGGERVGAVILTLRTSSQNRSPLALFVMAFAAQHYSTQEERDSQFMHRCLADIEELRRELKTSTMHVHCPNANAMPP